jgi:hypothetical protein
MTDTDRKPVEVTLLMPFGAQGQWIVHAVGSVRAIEENPAKLLIDVRIERVRRYKLDKFSQKLAEEDIELNTLEPWALSDLEDRLEQRFLLVRKSELGCPVHDWDGGGAA